MWQVVGHKWAVDLLKRALAGERVAHAYLLTGPPQIGRRSLALNFAQALNCLDEEKPYGQCFRERLAVNGLPSLKPYPQVLGLVIAFDIWEKWAVLDSNQ